MQKEKKAILVVSFGTSYHHTREKTIDIIENEIQVCFSGIHGLSCLDQQNDHGKTAEKRWNQD